MLCKFLIFLNVKIINLIDIRGNIVKELKIFKPSLMKLK